MDKKTEFIELATGMLTDYLVERKMRRTPERYEILKVVAGMKGLFTIDDVRDKMQGEAAFSVSKTTLFNTLEVLTDAQIVTKHHLRRAALYECSATPAPSVCTVCTQCGACSKVEDEGINSWLAELRVRQFGIHQPILYLHGLCRKCTAANNRKAGRKKGNRT